MKSLYAVATLLGSTSIALSNAQVIFNPNGTFTCPATGGAFCAGDSLSTNIIIRCAGIVGQAGNCNDNLAGVPPVGVKTFAPCWQSSSTAGDAACSYNGTVYADSGAFPIPTTSGSTPLPSTAPPYINSTSFSASSSISTTITLGAGSTTTGLGFTITGNPSEPTTIATVVPASSETGAGGGGGQQTETATSTAVVGGGGSSETGSSGAGATPTLSGSSASSILIRGHGWRDSNGLISVLTTTTPVLLSLTLALTVLVIGQI